VEIDRPGPHYAVDTLSILAEKNPGDHLVFVMGGDSLRDLPTWNRPSEIVARCHAVAVFPRPNAVVDLDKLETSLPGLRNKLHFIHAPLLEIAAHEIRRRIKSGQPFRYFLPPRVYAYIMSNHLYL
jgi:nicotinate-nucleotide adenylyltransferase